MLGLVVRYDLPLDISRYFELNIPAIIRVLHQ